MISIVSSIKKGKYNEIDPFSIIYELPLIGMNQLYELLCIPESLEY